MIEGLPAQFETSVAHPTWRASSVGVYRLWRDLGYAIGALLAGVAADALGLPAAMWLVAALTFASGLIVAVRMTETLVVNRNPGRVETIDFPHQESHTRAYDPDNIADCL